MTSNYYDLNAILAEELSVGCTFRISASNLGHFDQGSDNIHLEEGTNVELPLWLASILRKRNMVDMDTPNIFGPKYRASLKADASTVDLHSWCPHYYDVGMKIANLMGEPNLGPDLKQAFLDRFHLIMDLSLNSAHEDTSAFTSKLDELERQLFMSGFRAVIEYHKWHSRKIGKLSASAAASKEKRTRQSSFVKDVGHEILGDSGNKDDSRNPSKRRRQ
eukprot:Nk52_evm75s914 gene=Nk52_evmTU75s914